MPKRSLLVCYSLLLVIGFVVSGCQLASAQSPVTTTLVYSYVTSQTGLDTGLVITNASATPLSNDNGTAGTCTLTCYAAAGGQPLPPQTTRTIPAGQQVAISVATGGSGVSALAGFQGYIVAVCNFTLAQGVAIVSDLSSLKTLGLIPASILPAF